MHLSMVCPSMRGGGGVGVGQPRGHLTFQVFKCQFLHLWVTIITKILTPGDHKL